MTLDRAASQPERVSKHSYRDQQEEDAKPEAGGQRVVSLGQPNEGGDEEKDESYGSRQQAEHPADHKGRAHPRLGLELQLKVSAQIAHC